MHVFVDRLFAFANPDHPLDWTLYAALTDATFASAAALARANYDVVVDTVFERYACYETSVRALEGLRHHYVAVTCNLDELERREAARGNRPPGLARRQRDSVLFDVSYALTLDTSTGDIDACADQVAALFTR